jgi:hypothetical protein
LDIDDGVDVNDDNTQQEQARGTGLVQVLRDDLQVNEPPVAARRQNTPERDL